MPVLSGFLPVPRGLACRGYGHRIAAGGARAPLQHWHRSPPQGYNWLVGACRVFSAWQSFRSWLSCLAEEDRNWGGKQPALFNGRLNRADMTDR